MVSITDGERARPNVLGAILAGGFMAATFDFFAAMLIYGGTASGIAKAVARGWYGDLYIDHYVASRRAEADIVRGLRDGQVPQYEIARYFEIA